MWWRNLIVFLAYALLGAHFLRYGQTMLCIAYVIAPILLFMRQVYAIRLLQLGLLVSAIFVWGSSTFDYVQMRQSMNAPWLRLAAIMSGVIVFTLIAAYYCQALIKRRIN
ncbi:hypothetical protein [Shewanella sp. Isolate11]|uniref:hypothetical protein n=1 Tax=Shewanella sp. Isolate11 TaxID=2908530 RepID=UPI001EFD00A6|nr:hypothetical protein [Shewanella sp. Isolate11]MCG9696361.1 hypothetical protein [Shewanella sp. Isolate11]